MPKYGWEDVGKTIGSDRGGLTTNQQRVEYYAQLDQTVERNYDTDVTPDAHGYHSYESEVNATNGLGHIATQDVELGLDMSSRETHVHPFVD